MPQRPDLLGQQFGLLTVVASDTPPSARWVCDCVCGGRTVVATGALRSGNTKSCGCRKKAVLGESTTRHGGAGTALYSTWKGIMTRCYNKKAAAYKNYGGRGVYVVERWHDFAKFREDMGEASEGMSLERKRNNGPYSKRNCFWATRATQSRNTRRNVRVKFKGKTYVMTDLARKHNVRPSLASSRMRNGWGAVAACTLPPRASVKGTAGTVLKPRCSPSRGKALHIEET